MTNRRNIQLPIFQRNFSYLKGTLGIFGTRISNEGILLGTAGLGVKPDRASKNVDDFP